MREAVISWARRALDRAHLYPPRQRLEEQLRGLGREAQALAGVPHLRLEYERDLLHPERHLATVARVGAHVGVPLGRAETRLRKVVAADLRGVVTNYDAVCAFAARVGRLHELVPCGPDGAIG